MNIRYRLTLIVFLFGASLISQAQNYRISGGSNYSLILCQNGTIATWGSGALGQTGTSVGIPNGDVTSPTRIFDLPEIIKIDAGRGSHALGITCDGAVAAWGNNSHSQLGNCSMTSDFSANAVYVSGIGGVGILRDVKAIAAGGTASFALTADNKVVSWGFNGDEFNTLGGENYGVLGIGSTSETYISCFPQYVIDLEGNPIQNIIAIDAGETNTFALTADGQVYSWGDNQNEGNARTGSGAVAGFVTDENGDPIQNIVSIAAGDAHCLALDVKGNIWAWGGDWGPGQIGNSNASGVPGSGYWYLPYATKVAGGESSEEFLGDEDPIVAIGAGQSHSLAVTKQGFLYAWGGSLPATNGSSSDQYGMLGAGGTTASGCKRSGFQGSEDTKPGMDLGDNTTPVLALTAAGTPLTGIVDVSAGDFWSFAITRDNEVYVAGYGPNGELGTGNTIECYFTELIVPNCVLVAENPNLALASNEVCKDDNHTFNPGVIPPGFKAVWTLPNGSTVIQNNPYGLDGSTGMLELSLSVDNIQFDELGTYKLDVTDQRTATQRICQPLADINLVAELKEFDANYSASTNLEFCGNSFVVAVDGTPNGVYEWYPSMESTALLGTTEGVQGELILGTFEAEDVFGTTPNRELTVYAEDVSAAETTLVEELVVSNWNTFNAQGQVSRLYFTVHKGFTLNAIDVIYYSFSPTMNTTVKIFTLEGTPVKEVSSEPFGKSGRDTISIGLNVELEVGEYYIEAENIATANTFNEEAFKSYSVNNSPILEYTSVYRDFPGYINWDISMGNLFPCKRIPVTVYENCPPVITQLDKNEIDIVVSPNPFKDVLSVLSANEISRIELIDQQGKVVLLTKTNVLDTTLLSSGVYALKAYLKNGIFVEQVVKD